MSDYPGLQEQIARLLSEKMHVEIPSADMDLFETGVIDSLAFVDLLLHLEQEFGVQVSLAELELDNLRSIARIAEFVAQRNGSPGAAGRPGR